MSSEVNIGFMLTHVHISLWWHCDRPGNGTFYCAHCESFLTADNFHVVPALQTLTNIVKNNKKQNYASGLSLNPYIF